MKRLLLLSILFTFCASIAYAQRLKETDDMLDKQVLAVSLSGPQMALLEMKRELNLTDDQLTQVEKLHEERYQRMVEAESQHTDQLDLQLQYKSIQLKLDKILAEILTERQLMHYLELEGRQDIRLMTGKEEE